MPHTKSRTQIKHKPMSVSPTIAFTTPDCQKKAALLSDRLFILSRRRDIVLPPTNLPTVKSTGRIAYRFEDLSKSMVEAKENFDAVRWDHLMVLNNRLYFGQLCPKGKARALIGMLQNIPVIKEDTVSWDQIEDFKRDVIALTRFRGLRFWLIEGKR